MERVEGQLPEPTAAAHSYLRAAPPVEKLTELDRRLSREQTGTVDGLVSRPHDVE